jgi:Fe-S cluster assembly protein SufD
MAPRLARTEAETALAETFAAARARLPGALGEARASAFARFEERGLPHRRVEDWKYTDLRALMREALPLAAPPDEAARARARKTLADHALPGARPIVFVDGAFVAALSDLAGLETGLSIRPLAAALASGDASLADMSARMPAAGDPMFALNAAMMGDGAVIEVADGAVIERPIRLVHLGGGAPASRYTRSLVRVGRGARMTLVESFLAGADNDQVNDAVLLSIAESGRVEHVRMMEDGPGALNVATLVAQVGTRAHLNTFNLAAGAAVSRYQAFICCDGAGARIETNGVNLIKATQHADTSLSIDHAAPHCASRETFRAVVDNRARSVFQGRIVVRAEAQKTDAKMMTRALLLSDEAEADAKPELEIYADDVACGHGATSGALDRNLLFYLRARGLPEAEAQALLIQAFVGEVIESIGDDGLREAARAAALRYLAARRT